MGTAKFNIKQKPVSHHAPYHPSIVWATLAVFWGDCAWTSTFGHECMSFCWFEPGVWIRSGLWLSSAHAGHSAAEALHSFLVVFIPPPSVGAQKKCFLKSLHSSKKKKKKGKKVQAFTFAHTWIEAFHLIPNIFQSRSKEKCALFLLLQRVVLAHRTKKTNWMTKSFIWEIEIYLRH